jgi:hypothetical protein
MLTAAVLLELRKLINFSLSYQGVGRKENKEQKRIFIPLQFYPTMCF